MKFSKIIAATSLALWNMSTVDAMNDIHRPTYNRQFNDSISNITSFINDNYNEVIAKNCIMSIYNLTEPILRPFRVLLPMGNFRLDIAPIVAYIFFGIVRKVVFMILL